MRKWEKSEHKMPREGTGHGLLPELVRIADRRDWSGIVLPLCGAAGSLVFAVHDVAITAISAPKRYFVFIFLWV